MVLPLFLKSLKDQRRGLFFWSLGVMTIISVQLSVFPTVRSSAAGLAAFIENYPKAMRKIFRMEDYTSGSGYLSTELFSMMLPLIFIAVGAGWGVNAVAQEEERRTADVLFTLPISRARILTTKIISGICAQLLLVIVTFSTLVIGIRFVDISLPTVKILAASFSCAMLGTMFHAVAIFFGSVFGKKSIALGGAVALAIAGFLFYSLAPLVHTFDRVLGINPFQWALGSNPLKSGLALGYTVLSLVTMTLVYGASLLIIRSRDILA